MHGKCKFALGMVPIKISNVSKYTQRRYVCIVRDKVPHSGLLASVLVSGCLYRADVVIPLEAFGMGTGVARLALGVAALSVLEVFVCVCVWGGGGGGIGFRRS